MRLAVFWHELHPTNRFHADKGGFYAFECSNNGEYK